MIDEPSKIAEPVKASAAAPVSSKARARAAASLRRVGPTDIEDPFVLQEAKKAFIWLGIAAMLALVVVLAQPLIVIFGGLVFAALIDGGARLLRRVLPIGRAWRVTIILLVAAMFVAWVFYFAGSQIADQATALPITVRTQSLRLLGWAQQHGLRVDPKFVTNLENQALGGVGQITGVVGGLLGGWRHCS